MTSDVLVCVNHPSRETMVRCSNCGDPVCLECMQESAVGMKCPDCARLPRRARGVGRPKHVVKGALAGLGTATALSAGLIFLGTGLFGFFIPIILGLLVGEVISRASSRISTGPIVAISAIVTLGGLLLGPVVVGFPFAVSLSGSWILGSLVAAGAAAFRVSR